MKPHFFFLSLAIISPALICRADSSRPLTYQEIVDHARLHGPAWTEKIPRQGPRLLTLYQDKLARLAQGPYVDDTEEKLARAFLEDLPAAQSAEIPPWMDAAEGARKLGVILQDGRQQLWMRPLGGRLVALALAYRANPAPATAEALRALTLALVDYPTWGLSTPNNDLAAAEAAIGVSLAWDAARGLFDDAERERITAIMRARQRTMYAAALGPLFWAAHWQGNHNHICFASLGLAGLAFYHEIEQAPQWLAAAQLAFPRIMAGNHADGSTVEGVYYWSYGLHFILLQMEAQRPFLDCDHLYAAPYLQQGIDFRHYTSTAGFGGFVQFADAFSFDAYGPRHLMRRLASEYRRGDGQWLAERLPNPRTPAVQSLFGYLYYDPTLAPSVEVDRLDHHFTDWDVGVSRGGWGPGDSVLFLKAGYANVNHSSLDLGSLAFCLGDEWLLSVPGYGIVGPGFWDTQGRRWDYYSKATESHNTLLINGKNQRFDKEARGRIVRFTSVPDWTLMEADLTPAYHDVERVWRTVLHHRGEYVLVLDAWELHEQGTVEWLAQPRGLSIAAGNPLSITAETGQLKLHALLPVQEFLPRPPRSPFLNTGPLHRQTHALRQEGQSGVFVVLLEPVYGAGEGGHWTADTTLADDGTVAIRMSSTGKRHDFLWHPRQGFRQSPLAEGGNWAAYLEKARPRPPPAPIPVFPEIPSDRKILIQAEDFVEQTNGQVIVEPKAQALAQAIRGFGGQGEAHTLAWAVSVPQTGSYRLALRHATNLEPSLDVTLAGQTWRQQIPSTGGWANAPNEWAWHIVRDEEGREAVFPLTSGLHHLRFSRPQLAANWDAFVLLQESR